MYRKMSKYLLYLKKEHDVNVAELVTSDVIDRTYYLTREIVQKWPLDLSYTANKVRIFPNVYLCAYFNFK